MKICYISNSAAPSSNASSLQTAKLCEGLSKLGHEVKLILPDTGYKNDYFKFYNIKKKFSLEKIKFFKSFPKGIFYYLYTFISIYKSEIKKKDIYITRNFFTSLILSIFKKNHILEIHDDIDVEGRIIKFLIRNLEILNLKPLRKIITTTFSLKKKYTNDYNVKAQKIQVLHNASSLGPNFKKFKKKKKCLNIGYFGSLFESRGIKLIIDLSISDKENQYYIYGGSKADIDSLKKKYKNRNLHLSPYLPYSKVEKKIRGIDVCLLPYKSKITVSGNIGDISKYTSPLKIFDYMILGKLIVCTNLPVLKEILKDKQNSLLIQKNSGLTFWKKKIRMISKNYHKYENIRYNAYKYAKEHNIDWRSKKLLLF